MANIELIIKTIDKYLEQNNLTEITAVDANAVLARAGVLRDSSHRPGLPLRNILRQHLIPNAELRVKPGNTQGRWSIFHS